MGGLARTLAGEPQTAEQLLVAGGGSGDESSGHTGKHDQLAFPHPARSRPLLTRSGPQTGPLSETIGPVHLAISTLQTFKSVYNGFTRRAQHARGQYSLQIVGSERSVS
jgi:hypothetical protein